MGNTALVSGVTVGGNLLFCSMADYAFARIRFLGREAIFILLMATLMVPFQVTLIPTFLIIRWLGYNISPMVGIDSLGALVLPNLVTVFGVFMLRQFFRTLPQSIRSAPEMSCFRPYLVRAPRWWPVCLPVPALERETDCGLKWSRNRSMSSTPTRDLLCAEDHDADIFSGVF